MSDELESRNGHSIEIEKVIEVLERTPDKAEVMEALRGLRQDKVKAALGATVRAVKFDLSQTFEEFVQDGEINVALVTINVTP